MGRDGIAGKRVSGSVVTVRERSDQGDRSAGVSPPPRFAQGDIHEWHLWIDEWPRPGWTNMAIDLTLLDRAELNDESWLRLYQWRPHCLSFGRHEPATRRYDAERIAAMELDTVRRPTGGRAVWHGRQLTYAVAAPNRRFGTLQGAYLEIHEMLGAALRDLGASAALAPRARTSPLDAGACFAQPAGGEVMVSGRKVIGSAQLRRGAALLQHGSVLLEDDQRVVLSVSRGGGLGQARAAPPALPLGKSLPRLQVAEAIGRAAITRWQGKWKVVFDADNVLRAAQEHFPQFRSPAWTWAR